MNASKIEVGIAYIHGYITRQIEEYAAKANISQEDLASRLGTLLLLGTQGRIGTEDSMRALRVPSSELDQGIRKVARRGRPRKSGARKVKGVGQGGYWKSMTQEERNAEMRRRMAKRKAA
jgi:hypothetical protein